MKELLVVLQLALLLAQITVGVIGLRRKEDLLEFCYGYAIWACIPIVMIHFVVQSL